MGKQERNVNIDIMKSIATFGVCFAHFNNFMVYQLDEWFTLEGVLGYLFLVASACAVPVFLIINGYLVIYKSYSLKKYIEKAANVIIVTFIWGTIYNIVFGAAFHEKIDAIEMGRRIQEGMVYRGGVYQYKKLVFLGISYYLFTITGYKCNIYEVQCRD